MENVHTLFGDQLHQVDTKCTWWCASICFCIHMRLRPQGRNLRLESRIFLWHLVFHDKKEFTAFGYFSLSLFSAINEANIQIMFR